MPKNTFFRRKCVFLVQIWAIKWYPTIYFIIKYTSFQNKLPKLKSLNNELYSKNGRKLRFLLKKHVFSLKNVCFSTEFLNLIQILANNDTFYCVPYNFAKWANLKPFRAPKWPKMAIFIKKTHFFAKKVCFLGRISNCEHESS